MSRKTPKPVPGTVSHGTLRTADLVSAFEIELRHVNPAGYAQIMALPFDPVPGDARGDSHDEFWESEEASDYLSQLFDALDECAPEGHYFGAHPGDGSDFGYWEHDES